MFGAEARGAPVPKTGRSEVSPRRLLGLLAIALAILAAAVLVAPVALSPIIPSAQGQAATVQRGSLVSTVQTRGTVVLSRQVPLAFGTTGRVKEILVRLGETVQAGQILATLETTELEARLEQERSALRVAELQLQQAKGGATAEQIESAKVALEAAKARAQEIANGAPRPEIDAARAAVLAAEAALAGAIATREQLEAGPLPADRAAAEQAVAEARAALQKAESDLEKLKAGCAFCLWWTFPRPTAEADLQAANLELEAAKQKLFARQVSRDAACAAGKDQSGCKAAEADVWAADLEVKRAELKLQQIQGTPRPDDIAAAERSVESARKALATAEARLQQVLAGPTQAEIQSARSAEKKAEADLLTARARLEQLEAGAKQSDLQAAQAAVASAEATLAALTNTQNGEVAMLEERVRQAQINVNYAEAALKSAVLTAPFDGVVNAITAQVGEQVAGPTPAITLVDPRAVRVETRMEGPEVAKIQPGKEVEVTFDALGGRQFLGHVAAVSPVDALQKESPSYIVSVDFEPGDVRLTPGLVANLTMILDRKDDALVVPNRALRRQGQDQVVEVVVNGKPEIRTVRTGIANDQYTEIVEGLAEGESVVLLR